MKSVPLHTYQLNIYYLELNGDLKEYKYINK